jgi:hypothetical protein
MLTEPQETTKSLAWLIIAVVILGGLYYIASKLN